MADVGDGNPAGAACGDIDHVVARRRNCDHFELGKLR
jgi:hypothetical protein